MDEAAKKKDAKKSPPDYPPPYTYCVNHGPQNALRLLLNDIPFYRVLPERNNITRNTVADHLLVPGENTFAWEILQADPRNTASFDIQLEYDRENHLFEWGWPKCYDDVPFVMEYPQRYETTFQMPDFKFRSAFLDAPPEPFPDSGNPSQHLAIRKFLETLHKADADAFMDELSLKTQELQRAYPRSPFFDEQHLRSTFRERFSNGLQVRDVEMNELQFESRADGRVAYITRRDGGFPIEVFTPDGQGMQHDLWLTQDNGMWRIFR